MIAIDHLLAELLIYCDDDDRGQYYCGCRYVRGEAHCPHHGDPVEKFPEREDEPTTAD